MDTKDFTSSIIVSQTPAEVFSAILNVRGWWSEEIEGGTSKEGDLFTYRYGDAHRCKMKLIEVIPNKVVVWHVLENYFSFIEEKEKEWTNDKVIFEISKVGDKTQLQMTHVGLTPQNECYSACYDGWTYYIQTSLKSLIETGKGMPNAKETPRTATEKKLTGN